MSETWGSAGEVGVGFVIVARWSCIVFIRKEASLYEGKSKCIQIGHFRDKLPLPVGGRRRLEDESSYLKLRNSEEGCGLARSWLTDTEKSYSVPILSTTSMGSLDIGRAVGSGGAVSRTASVRASLPTNTY